MQHCQTLVTLAPVQKARIMELDKIMCVEVLRGPGPPQAEPLSHLVRALRRRRYDEEHAGAGLQSRGRRDGGAIRNPALVMPCTSS